MDKGVEEQARARIEQERRENERKLIEEGERLLKIKDDEITELNGQILKLKDDNQAIKNELKRAKESLDRERKKHLPKKPQAEKKVKTPPSEMEGESFPISFSYLFFD